MNVGTWNLESNTYTAICSTDVHPILTYTYERLNDPSAKKVEDDSTNLFNIAEEAIANSDKLRKIVILKRLPRYDIFFLYVFQRYCNLWCGLYIFGKNLNSLYKCFDQIQTFLNCFKAIQCLKLWKGSKLLQVMDFGLFQAKASLSKLGALAKSGVVL